MSTHTPTPWTLRNTGTTLVAIQGSPAIGETYGQMVTISSGGFAKPMGAGAANAAFVVRAVNCHDDLVAALKAVCGIGEEYEGMEWSDREKMVTDALAKAAP